MNPLDDYVVFDVETVPDRYDEYRSLFPKSKRSLASMDSYLR